MVEGKGEETFDQPVRPTTGSGRQEIVDPVLGRLVIPKPRRVSPARPFKIGPPPQFTPVPFDIPALPTLPQKKPVGLYDDPFKVKVREERRQRLFAAIQGARGKLKLQADNMAAVKADLDKSKAVWEQEMAAARNLSESERKQAQITATARLQQAVAEQRSKYEPAIATLKERLLGMRSEAQRVKVEVERAHEQEMAQYRERVSNQQLIAIKDSQREIEKIRAEMDAEKLKVSTEKVGTQSELARLREALRGAREKLSDQKQAALSKLTATERTAVERAQAYRHETQKRLDSLAAERDQATAQAKQEIASSKQEIANIRSQPQPDPNDRLKIAEAAAKIAELNRALGVAEGGVSQLRAQLKREKGLQEGQIDQLKQAALQLDKARADAQRAVTTGSADAAAAAARESKLQSELAALSGKLGVSEAQVRRLTAEAATAPMADQARIAGLEAAKDQLQKRVEDLKDRVRSGDTGRQADLQSAQRDMDDLQRRISVEHASGVKVGIAQGRAQEAQRSRSSMDAVRADFEHKLRRLQSQLDAAQVDARQGKTFDAAKLREQIQRSAQEMAAVQQRMSELTSKHAAELTGVRTEAERTLSQTQAEAARALEAERRSTLEQVQAAEETAKAGHESELQGYSTAHQRELEAEQMKVRTAVKALADARLQHQEGLTGEQQSSQQALDALKAVHLRQVQQLEERVRDAERRAEQQTQVATTQMSARDLAQQAQKTALAGQQKQTDLAERRKADVARITQALQDSEKQMRAAHAKSLAQMTANADSAKAQAVKDAIAREQSASRGLQAANDSLVAQKDAEIKRHVAHHVRIQKALQEAQVATNNQMSALRGNLKTVLDTNRQHVEQIQRMQRQYHETAMNVQQLEAQGRIQKASAERAIARLNEDNQQLQGHAQRLAASSAAAQQGYLRQTNQLAAEAAHQQDVHMKESRAQSDLARRAHEQKVQMLQQRHASEMLAQDKQSALERQFSQAHSNLVMNPDQETVERFRTLAGQHTSNMHVQQMQQAMELVMADHTKARQRPSISQVAEMTVPTVPSPSVPEAPTPRPKPGVQGIETPDPLAPDVKGKEPVPIPISGGPGPLEIGEEKEDVRPRPRQTPVYTAPAGPIRSLEQVVGEEVYAKYQDRVQAAMATVATGQYQSRRREEQAAYEQFNQNPALDLSTIPAEETRFKIERMQAGHQEAHAHRQNREQELSSLSNEEQVSELEEDRLEAMYQLYQAKQRRE